MKLGKGGIASPRHDTVECLAMGIPFLCAVPIEVTLEVCGVGPSGGMFVIRKDTPLVEPIPAMVDSRHDVFRRADRITQEAPPGSFIVTGRSGDATIKFVVTQATQQAPNSANVYRSNKNVLIAGDVRSKAMSCRIRCCPTDGPETAHNICEVQVKKNKPAALCLFLHSPGTFGTRMTSGKLESETRKFLVRHVLALLKFGAGGMAGKTETIREALRETIEAFVPPGADLSADAFADMLFDPADPEASCDTVEAARAQLDRDLHVARSGDATSTNCAYRPEEMHPDAKGVLGVEGLERRVLPGLEKDAKLGHFLYGVYRLCHARHTGIVDNKQSPSLVSVDAPGYMVTKLFADRLNQLISQFHRSIVAPLKVTNKVSTLEDCLRDIKSKFEQVFKTDASKTQGRVMRGFSTNSFPALFHFGRPIAGAVQDLTLQNSLAMAHEVGKMAATTMKRKAPTNQHVDGFVCPITKPDGGNVAQQGHMACGAMITLHPSRPEDRIEGVLPKFMEPSGFIPFRLPVPALEPGHVRAHVFYRNVFVGMVDSPADGLAESREEERRRIEGNIRSEQKRLLGNNPRDPVVGELATVSVAWRTVPSARASMAAPPKRAVGLHISAGRGRLTRAVLVADRWDTRSKVERNLRKYSRMSLLDLQIRGLVRFVDPSANSAAGPVIVSMFEFLDSRNPAVTDVDIEPSLRLSLLTSTLVDSTKNALHRLLIGQHQKRQAGDYTLHVAGPRFVKSMTTLWAHLPVVTTVTARSPALGRPRANLHLETIVTAFRSLESEDGNPLTEGTTGNMLLKATQTFTSAPVPMVHSPPILSSRTPEDAKKFTSPKTLWPGEIVGYNKPFFEKCKPELRSTDGSSPVNRSCSDVRIDFVAVRVVHSPKNGFEVIVKFKTGEVRFPITGDKITNQAAQKGTVTVIPRHLMPRFGDGSVAQLVVAAQNTALRGTIGALFTVCSALVGLTPTAEGEQARLAAMFSDGSAFRPSDGFVERFEQFSEMMEGDRGSLGVTTLYDAEDGQRLDALYAPMAKDVAEAVRGSSGYGFIPYTPVDHLPTNKAQWRGTGTATNANNRHGWKYDRRTGGVPKGRIQRGGSNIGDMENNVIMAHGMGTYLMETQEHADVALVPFCQKCSVMRDSIVGRCIECKGPLVAVRMRSKFVFHKQLLNAMGVDLTFETGPTAAPEPPVIRTWGQPESAIIYEEDDVEAPSARRARRV